MFGKISFIPKGFKSVNCCFKVEIRSMSPKDSVRVYTSICAHLWFVSLFITIRVQKINLKGLPLEK